MPLPSYHNVANEAKVVLVEQGVEISKISNVVITNTHSSNSTLIDLYIGSLAKGGTVSQTSYYIIKNKFLHTGESIILKNPVLSFNSNDNGYSLIMQLTGVGTTAPTVDVLLK